MLFKKKQAFFSPLSDASSSQVCDSNFQRSQKESGNLQASWHDDNPVSPTPVWCPVSASWPESHSSCPLPWALGHCMCHANTAPLFHTSPEGEITLHFYLVSVLKKRPRPYLRSHQSLYSFVCVGTNHTQKDKKKALTN